MPYNLTNCLVIGISSRALFNLEAENTIFENEGVESYAKYQQEHEKDILKPGAGFHLVKALLKLNSMCDTRKTEVIIMSRNNADTSLRIFNSIEHYGLDISRAALVGGSRLSPYLPAFNIDLFLSANAEDVQDAINSGTAAGIICTQPDFEISPLDEIDQIKIAFDGDAVLFSDESEKIYKENGLDAFLEYERQNAKKPLPEGPFARFLKKLASIQKQFPTKEAPIKTALVTSRNAPAHERVILTLRAWNVRIDEAFFLGGVEKSEVLKAFGAHIFFDDQPVHIGPASKVVPSARVPYKTE
ncbi:MAG: 5'-nucleotidase [Clostridia bacterium]|jgi:5'-nucleotidase|nr:5'-nucleotidase [Clostridia bacterium]